MATYRICQLSSTSWVDSGRGEIMCSCDHKHRTPEAAARCRFGGGFVKGSDGSEYWCESDNFGHNTGEVTSCEDLDRRRAADALARSLADN
jgi:hypothetical protein